MSKIFVFRNNGQEEGMEIPLPGAER